MDKSRDHIGFVKAEGKVYELLKAGDYILAHADGEIEPSGNRSGRFFCDGSWSSHRLAKTMVQIGYETVD